MSAEEEAQKGARTVVEDQNGWGLQQDRIARFAKATCEGDPDSAFDVLQEEFGSSGAALTVSSYLHAAMSEMMDAQETAMDAPKRQDASGTSSADEQLRQEVAERSRIEQFARTLRTGDSATGLRILRHEFGAQHQRVVFYLDAAKRHWGAHIRWLIRRTFVLGVICGVLAALIFVALVTWSNHG